VKIKGPLVILIYHIATDYVGIRDKHRATLATVAVSGVEREDRNFVKTIVHSCALVFAEISLRDRAIR